jgi:hypothetical protein
MAEGSQRQHDHPTRHQQNTVILSEAKDLSTPHDAKLKPQPPIQATTMHEKKIGAEPKFGAQ